MIITARIDRNVDAGSGGLLSAAAASLGSWTMQMLATDHDRLVKKSNNPDSSSKASDIAHVRNMYSNDLSGGPLLNSDPCNRCVTYRSLLLAS